jgi:hypothetical protein
MLATVAAGTCQKAADYVLIVREAKMMRGESGMKLTIRPLTPDLWSALEDLFGENGAVDGCRCMYWRIGRAIRKRSHEEDKVAFRKVVRLWSTPGLTRLRRQHSRGAPSLQTL